MLANWWFTDLIVVGTFWFWAFVIAVFFGTALLVEIEKAGFAFLVLVGTVLVFQFASDFNVLHYVTHNWWVVVAGVFGWAICGVLWSMIKLHFYEKKRRGRYDALKRNFLILNDVPDDATNIPDPLKSEWLAYLDKNAPYYDKMYYLRNFNDPTQHQSRIVSWIGYWPFSLALTILNDPLRKIGNAIFESLKGTYASIIKSAWKGVEGDFNADEIRKLRQGRR